MSRSALPLFALSAFLLPLSRDATAQAEPGSAVAIWKTVGVPGPGGLTLVDRAGRSSDVTGLDPATLGTSELDGARSVVLTSTGVLFAGLGVDNRNGTAPVPLQLRRILLRGSAAASDQHFATLMAVPPGQIWHASDLKERADGSLLVAATETLLTANPMPAKTAFVVDANANVTALPTSGYPAGSLVAITATEDRYVAAFYQSFFVVNVELVSLGYSASDPVFRVHQFVNMPAFAGMGTDVDGTLIVCGGFQNTTIATTVVRMPHAANSTPAPVPGTPAAIAVCDVIPGPALVASLGPPGVVSPPLYLTDTLAGGNTVWSGLARSRFADVAVRGNPGRYGPTSRATPPLPFLGSFGRLPTTGNTGFGLRVGGTPGSAGVVLAGLGRASVPTPFGVFLLDATRPLFVLATLTIPNAGFSRTPFPIPNDPALAGATADLQAILITRLTPPAGETTAGLEITVQ